MTPTNSCLDGETLAAWVDGGLSRNDATMAEAHVSSCPRCQEIAGLIVKTTPATIADAPWWRRRAAWLIPVTAGAVAAGLLIAPADRAPTPASPPATATLESTRATATPAAPPIAPPAERKAADTKVTQTRAQTKEVETKQERKRDERANPAIADATAPVANAPPAAALGRRAEEQVAQKSVGPAGAKQAVSPDGALHWRITDGGALERSTDGVTSWQAVNVGVTTTLISVQAPAPRAALVTTTDGRVFRTSDGGATWRLVVPKL